MTKVPKVRITAHKGWVVLHITNGMRDPNDLRVEAPREVEISVTAAMKLVVQLGAAILKARLWRQQNRNP